MPQIVLQAEPGEYAPIVLLPGDPQRAERIARRFDGGLAAATQVAAHRGLPGWTGTFDGTPISVQTTGMGSPSMSIIVEELLRLGARTLVRLGTCGGIGRGITTGDLLVATSAAPVDGATRTHLRGDPYAPTADFELTRCLVDAARAVGCEPHIGPVATVDLLYNPHADYLATWRARGILAFEMEAAALFYLASRARATGVDVRAGCLLVVSDVLTDELTSEQTYLPLDVLAAASDRMIGIGLAASATCS